MTDVRGEILDYVRRQLIGPAFGADERLEDSPDQRYAVGILYPREVTHGDALSDDIEDESGASFRDVLADDPVALASQHMPSSVGLSFFALGGRRVRCQVGAATYAETREGRRSAWSRQPLNAAGGTVTLAWEGEGRKDPVRVLGGLASVVLNVRRLGDGDLVTVSVVNEAEHDGKGRPDPGKCLYQVSLECTALDGRIAEYPRLEFLTADEEEEELFLAYRNSRIFALGHGCAAGWDAEPGSASAAAVRADFIPSREVAALTPIGDESLTALALNRLADPRVERQVVISGLRSLLDEYGRWIGGLEAITDIPSDLVPARDRVIDRLRKANARMRAGLDLLASDSQIHEAFRLANLAMLMQMHHSRVIASDRQVRGQPVFEEIDYLALGEYRWYPFQIAFLLLTLPSLVNPESPERDVVDLLWFPTGGGKTEAYLLAASLVIFLRRIRQGDRGAGTTVITRYTLRLLTTQQFQRAAALTCAAEQIRKAEPDRLGTVPISIGLWVGEGASPNKFVQARALAERLLGGAPADELLPIEQCPWCGTEILPHAHSDDRAAFGFEATNSSFKLFCPTDLCPFHEGLPVSIVDEDMYTNPPTIVVGTVDKFARLAWSDGGGAFFGLGRFEPPSLIIQDELHLISGPLGTTVGLYESAIEGLLELADAHPKVLASTATIRRANDQSRGVFGRNVALFPPSGLAAGDSYFARVDAMSPGRLYVGVMSQNHTPTSALVHIAAVLAQAPVELGLQGSDLDAYWTQVIYHNSLRELGKSVTFARDDIPARVGVIAAVEDHRRRLGDAEVVELTSNIASSQITGILARMKATHQSGDAISLLLATNMIQVGIDVPRLGLMLVNGQPKTTSEYIQASSRVGRGTTPGLVVTLYSPNKPRDRSHYEAFASYHDALYRQVEPTSVTPYSLPSRERGLAAALIILVRHGAGLARNDAAIDFRHDDPRVRRAVATLLRRVEMADPLELVSTEVHIARLLAEWEDKAREAKHSSEKFYYESSGKQHRRLMKHFGQSGEGWPVLDSMRSVDRQCAIEVIGSLAGG